MNHLASGVILLLATMFFLFSLYGSHGLLQLQDVDGEIVRMRQRTEALDAEIAQLKSEIAQVGTSEFILEQKSREELGLARPGEVVYIFPSESRSNGAGRVAGNYPGHTSGTAGGENTSARSLRPGIPVPESKPLRR